MLACVQMCWCVHQEHFIIKLAMEFSLSTIAPCGCMVCINSHLLVSNDRVSPCRAGGFASSRQAGVHWLLLSKLSRLNWERDN